MTNICYIYRYFTLGMMLALLSGIILFGWSRTAQAADRGPHQREFQDSRYHHDRFYPTHGRVLRELPRDHRVVVHGGARYYFSGGAWYRPQGPRFSVIVPPIGLFVPFLPPYYATIWLRGVPYYYANEVYYAHRGAATSSSSRRRRRSARRRRRWTRCSSIPAWGRAKNSRRMIGMRATSGP
jgi:hypothetical protein